MRVTACHLLACTLFAGLGLQSVYGEAVTAMGSLHRQA